MKPILNSLRLSSCLALALSFAGARGAEEPSPEQLLLKDFKPRSIYNVPVTRLSKARFPVIDMHSHDYAKSVQDIAEWVRTMDELGIEKTVILTYAHGPQFDAVLARYQRFPGRFSVWCGFDYTGYDQPGYGPVAVAELESVFQGRGGGSRRTGRQRKGLVLLQAPRLGDAPRRRPDGRVARRMRPVGNADQHPRRRPQMDV